MQRYAPSDEEDEDGFLPDDFGSMKASISASLAL